MVLYIRKSGKKEQNLDETIQLTFMQAFGLESDDIIVRITPNAYAYIHEKAIKYGKINGKSDANAYQNKVREMAFFALRTFQIDPDILYFDNQTVQINGENVDLFHGGAADTRIEREDNRSFEKLELVADPHL